MPLAIPRYLFCSSILVAFHVPLNIARVESAPLPETYASTARLRVAAVAADRLRPGAHTEIEAESVYAHLPRPVPASLALVLDRLGSILEARFEVGPRGVGHAECVFEDDA